ncbi:hypothetical protein X797_011824 [Metarhizium robertsii]|uniref:Uncharacterized protein n=1 Tax=Metarhizium robertsii TaxID=568076 RepID=A0A014PHN6_9HYPO|nr:hypothetical protein X797_011824 [Metarhizium robertsii]
MRIFQTSFHLACLCTLATAVLITDRFNVDVTSRMDGGCGWVGEQKLNEIFEECLTLAETGIRVVNDYSTSKEAARILDPFFSTGGLRLTARERNQIKAKYTRVRDWIQNGGLVNGGRKDKKPLLFCHHTWLQKGTMADVARRPDGSDMDKWDKSLKRRVKILIREIPKYVRQQRVQQTTLNAQGKPNSIAVPVGIPPDIPTLIPTLGKQGEG